jgi:hypothetical protein
MPVAQAAMPVAQVAMPVAQAAMPVAQAAMPVAQVAMPVAQAAMPVAQAAMPVAQVAMPVAQVAMPVAGKPRPGVLRCANRLRVPLRARQPGQPRTTASISRRLRAIKASAGIACGCAYRKTPADGTKPGAQPLAMSLP